MHILTRVSSMLFSKTQLHSSLRTFSLYLRRKHMALFHFFRVHCDGCGAHGPKATRETQALKNATKDGWTNRPSDRRVHFCPECTAVRAKSGANPYPFYEISVRGQNAVINSLKVRSSYLPHPSEVSAIPRSTLEATGNCGKKTILEIEHWLQSHGHQMTD